MEDYNRYVELQEKKRLDDWNAKDARIQGLMNRMADTVLKDRDHAEKELEGKIKRYEEEKERTARKYMKTNNK